MLVHSYDIQVAALASNTMKQASRVFIPMSIAIKLYTQSHSTISSYHTSLYIT